MLFSVDCFNYKSSDNFGIILLKRVRYLLRDFRYLLSDKLCSFLFFVCWRFWVFLVIRYKSKKIKKINARMQTLQCNSVIEYKYPDKICLVILMECQERSQYKAEKTILNNYDIIMYLA